MANDEGGERTEDPTGHQLSKARDEGNVAKSRELSAGIMLLVVAIFLYFYMPYMLENCEDIFRQFYMFTQAPLDTGTLRQIMFYCFLAFGKIILPFFLAIYVTVFLIEAAQAGLHISTKALEPKWDRINFFTGLPKFFAVKRKLVELAKSLFKIIVLGYMGVKIVRDNFDGIMASINMEYMEAAVFTGKLLFEILFKMALLVIVLGVADYAYQRWQRKADLKMTKQQVKEEFKQMEGDPLIRQRIREAQRELARKRMMEDVPKSDVVVTNPTHFAVALKYTGGGAPRVVAKGQRLMALKIKDIARESGVYIHEDKPLAQTLYKTLDIGDEIPENLYKAVAEILAVVYNKKGRAKPN